MTSGPSSPSLRRALPVAPTGLPFALEPVYWSLMKERRNPDARDPAYLLRVQRHGMTRAWRRKICRWMCQTAREFDLQMDSVGNAMRYLDEFLSLASVDRSGLQLMAMVSLWLATKLHEARPILTAEMAIMCERKFSRDDMLDAEQRLATAIHCRFSPPNCFSYARDLVAQLPVKRERDREACLESVFLLLERGMEDVASVACDASSLALAAVQLVAQSEFGLSKNKLSAGQLLRQAAFLIADAPLAKATELLSDVYYRHAAAADLVAEASVTASPTGLEELYDYVPVPVEAAKEVCLAVDGLDASSLMADESETLESDSETPSPSPSPSPRKRLARHRDECDDEDECEGAAKRRRTA